MNIGNGTRNKTDERESRMKTLMGVCFVLMLLIGAGCSSESSQQPSAPQPPASATVPPTMRPSPSATAQPTVAPLPTSTPDVAVCPVNSGAGNRPVVGGAQAVGSSNIDGQGGVVTFEWGNISNNQKSEVEDL